MQSLSREHRIAKEPLALRAVVSWIHAFYRNQHFPSKIICWSSCSNITCQKFTIISIVILILAVPLKKS